MTATAGNVDIDANVDAAGDSILTLEATNGNVNIAQAADAAVTSVSGKIDIDAGTSVLLGEATPYIGQIVTTGTGDIEITAATAFTMDDEPGTIVSSGGKITIDPATVTIDADGLLAVGDISVTADGGGTAAALITVNGDVESTAGLVTLAAINNFNTGGSTVTVNANLIGNDVEVTATDTDDTDAALVEFTATSTNTRGGYTVRAESPTGGETIDLGFALAGIDDITLNAATIDIDANITTTQSGGITLKNVDVAAEAVAAVTLAADLSAIDNILIGTAGQADTLVLDGVAATRTITSTSGNVTFSGTVNDDGFADHSLTVNAGDGLVDFTTTVGNAEPPLNLTVAAKNVEFNGAVTVDTDLILTNSENVLLATGAIVLTATNGDVFFNAAGQLDGAQTLQVVAGDDAIFGTVGATTPPTGLDVDVAGTRYRL
jgi:hypothetical protein